MDKRIETSDANKILLNGSLENHMWPTMQYLELPNGMHVWTACCAGLRKYNHDRVGVVQEGKSTILVNTDGTGQATDESGITIGTKTQMSRKNYRPDLVSEHVCNSFVTSIGEKQPLQHGYNEARRRISSQKKQTPMA